MKGFPDARPERWLGALSLIVIALISLGNVVTRYLTGGSFSFTEEFSVFLLVVLTFAGASVALRRDRHIRIGFFRARIATSLAWCVDSLSSPVWLDRAGLDHLVRWQASVAGVPMGVALAGLRAATVVVFGMAARAVGGHAVAFGAANP